MNESGSGRSILLHVGLALAIVGCAAPAPPPPTRPAASDATTPVPSPRRTEPMAMDELRAAYEGQGLECYEREQNQGGLEPGIVLNCEMLVDGHWLVVEAPYSIEGILLRLHAQMPVVVPGGDTIDSGTSERAMAIVLSIAYPGHDADAAEERLRGHLDDGDCDLGYCSVASGAGRWRLLARPEFGSWILRLDLDDPPA